MPFDWLLTETPVAADLRRMLKLLEEAYEHPVASNSRSTSSPTVFP
jgi:hypothetical protein